MCVILVMTFKYSSCLEALVANDVQELKRMRENGHEFQVSNDEIKIQAIEHGDVAMIEYIHDHVDWFDNRAAVHICLENKLELLQFLYTKGVQVNCPFTIARVAIKDNLEIVKFLRENGCDWNHFFYLMATGRCLDYAFTNGCPIEWRLFEGMIYVSPEPTSDDFNPINSIEKFQWVALHHPEPQAMWNSEHRFNESDLDSFNLDDPPIRNLLFSVNLAKVPELQQRVQYKKDHIAKSQEACRTVVACRIPKDIVEYCLIPFF
jgi:hypothetical protein